MLKLRKLECQYEISFSHFVLFLLQDKLELVHKLEVVDMLELVDMLVN